MSKSDKKAKKSTLLMEDVLVGPDLNESRPPLDKKSTPSMEEVLVGPDLNESRPPLDKKLYRQILLKNGLRAVLISDTVAMHQSPPQYYSDSEDDDDDDGHSKGSHENERMQESDKEDGERMMHESDDDDESYDDEDEEGLREAAAAMVVGVGSMYDPPEAQGLAHFLEHMLFMGTKKYPEENAYDAFLSKHGGTDNAYTDLEHTVYHLQIPQEELFPALDMFAQFFIHPLLLEDAVERELNSIESEFQLSKNSDQCRVQQLMCHTCGQPPQHPFRKFSWGNLESLKEEPLRNGTDTMKELRKLYNQYYYAQNMKLVVVGAYSLDTLQQKVLNYFHEIPALSREPSPLQPIHVKAGAWEEEYQSKMASMGLPFHDDSLKTIFRIVPVQDRHSLSITWQVPSQMPNWRSKPCDFLAHLIGHEAQGSILSSLKEKSWAFGCMAGVGSEGLENASSHGLFIATFTLSEEGVSHWSDIVAEVYQYLGMLRYYCSSPSGLPEWIYQELKNIHDVSYRYGDEPSSDDLVMDLAEELAPHCILPPERLLDGSDLLFDYDPDAIKNLLDNFLTPQNARIDLMSSTFGRAADFEVDEDGMENGNVGDMSEEGDQSAEFDASTAGPPAVEPMFGTRYWRRSVPEKAMLREWTTACVPDLPSHDSPLSLPPKNPFVPESYALKSLPPDDDDHPLVHSSLKLCVTIGKKKSWFPATVTKYNGVKNRVLLAFEDDDEKWHAVDQEISHFSSAVLSPGYEGTLDSKKIKYRIIALASQGKGPQMKYGDVSDDHVGDGAQFPLIPPAHPESRLPQLLSNTQVLKLWHLQDRTFKRPIAELRLRLICGDANKTPLHKACADLLVHLCSDVITETTYLASVCELGSSFESTDVGFTLRVHGFDDKLLDLFRLLFGVILSFRGRSTLPDTIKEGRFEACLELQRRKYANQGMKASKLCSSGRIRCLRPNVWSSHSKASALIDIDEAIFCTTISEVLSRIGMEALYYGNVDRNDAQVAQELLLNMVQSSGDAGLPRKKYPSELVTKIPHSLSRRDVVLPSRDATEPNSAVEVYFQVGKDSIDERVIIDLLAHAMYEPLYDQVRTKDQFGYEVTCDSRWTCGVMGLYFRVVSSTKSAAKSVERIERFLLDYYQELKGMSQEDFMVEVVGLAKNKLDMHDSLADACDALWAEIRDGRYVWQVEREEVLSLRNVTKEKVLSAFEEWFLPTTIEGKPRKRRMVTVQVIGTGEGSASEGRPNVEDSAVDEYVDERIRSFHKSVGSQTWGRIY